VGAQVEQNPFFFYPEDGRPYSGNSLAFIKPKVQHPALKSSPLQEWRSWQKSKHSEKSNFRLCCEYLVGVFFTSVHTNTFHWTDPLCVPLPQRWAFAENKRWRTLL